MSLHLWFVGGDKFFAAVLALCHPSEDVSSVILPLTFVIREHEAQGDFGIRHNHTIDVGLGALTGRPLALTGARVPAFSAALCSRWTCADMSELNTFDIAQRHVL